MIKKLMKIHKKQKGFTLVEVIVVAVIVAVLAAVAIPIYLNYVDTSKTNQAENIAGALASFAGACETDGAGGMTAGAEVGLTTVTCGNNDAEIIVPDGFTCTVTATTVVCTDTDDVTLTSKVYDYAN